MEEGQRLHEIYARRFQELEEEREVFRSLQEGFLERAEDTAAAIVETTMRAIMATRDMFDEIYRPNRLQRLKRWFKNVWNR